MQGLRREIAELLAAGKEDSARIRVESVHREENLLVAFTSEFNTTGFQQPSPCSSSALRWSWAPPRPEQG